VDDDELKHSVLREQQRVLRDRHTASHVKVENCADMKESLWKMI